MKKFLIVLSILLFAIPCFADSETTVGGKTARAHLIQEEGTSLRPRSYLNFIGDAVTCVDNNGKTECTITGGSGSGGAGNTFMTWDLPSGDNIVADSTTDTATFTASNGLSITGTAATDTLAFALALSGQATIDTAGGVGLQPMAIDYWTLATATTGDTALMVDATDGLLKRFNVSDLIEYNSGDNYLMLDQTTPQTIINGVPLLEETRTIDDEHQLVDKYYVDQAVTSIGARYYMVDTASGTEDYKLTQITPSADPEASDAHADVINDEYLRGWIAPQAGVPTKLITGVYDWVVYAQQTDGTGQKDLRLYWELIEYELGGNEIVIATSENSNLIGTAKTKIDVFLTVSEDYEIASDSYVVGKVYADVSGSGGDPSVTLFYEGDGDSHWEIPTNTEVLMDTFVPYIGATSNINLGSYDLTTTGDVSAANMKVTGVFNAGADDDPADVYIHSGGGLWIYEDSNDFVVGAVCKDSAAEWQFNDDVNIGASGAAENLVVWGNQTNHGTVDFGGATSIEMPQNSTVDALGKCTLDTTDFTWVCHDGTAARVMGHDIYQQSFTVEDDGDYTNDVVPVFRAPKDMAVTLVQVTMEAMGNTTTVNFEERAYGSLGSAGTDIFTTDVIVATTGNKETSFSNASIAADATLVFIPSADGGATSVTGTFYYRKAVE